jgi:hypothetical protein
MAKEDDQKNSNAKGFYVSSNKTQTEDRSS